MLTASNNYGLEINRGHSPINDHIFDFLKKKIGKSDFLDIGSNVSILQRELGRGTGVDADIEICTKNNQEGYLTIFADACDLPFADKTFPIAVLSCVLQQTSEPIKALNQARRVAERVIGISPYPNKSQWGIVGGNEWVKSVIDPEDLKKLGFKIQDLNDGIHYYFYESPKRNKR